MMPPKKRAAAKQAESPPKRRQLQRRDTDEQVSRLLTEHFSSFSVGETDHTYVAGKNLRQTLTQYKHDKKLTQGRLSASLKKRLRSEFGQGSGCLSEVKVQKELPVRDTLQQALLIARTTNPGERNCGQLLLVLSEQTRLNQREFVGLCRAVVEMSATIPVQRKFTVAFARTIAQMQYRNDVPEVIDKLGPHLDQVYCQTYCVCKKERASDEFFIEMLGEGLELHPIGSSIKKFVHAGAQKKIYKHEIALAVTKSFLAKTMFGASVAGMSTETFSEEVDTAVDEFFKPQGAAASAVAVQKLTAVKVGELKEPMLTL